MKSSIYPTIHDFTGTDLDTQGFGALSDCISAEVTEELNGGFSLALKYPLKGLHSEYLTVGNIIMAKPNHAQTQQPFRISQVKKSFGNSINVTAYHICYDLSGYPFQYAQSFNSLSAVFNALNNASWNTGASVYHQFMFQTDITSNLTFKMDSIQTVRSWMGGQEGSILDVYGGEWEYDRFNCYLKSRRGTDTGIRISYGKNLAEYDKEQNNAVYSHVCAYWKQSEMYVCSDLVGTGAVCPFRCVYYDATNEFEEQPTTTQLNTVATARALSMNMNAQTITVTPAQIGEVIGLGDSVLICYEDVFQTRVVKTVWNVLAGVYSKLELGTKKTGIADTIKSLNGSESNSAGKILEEGMSGNWYYEKRSNGIYKCWYRGTGITVDVTTLWQGIYYGSIAGVNFPITFISLLCVNQTVEVDDGGETTSFYPCTLSKTSGAILYRPNSKSGITASYNIEAIGRWK